MSLSQKHSGKVLVPWFNTAEWKTVYELIYSDDITSQKQALGILKVWKIRTPLLPAGVEGTLIVLEALLLDRSSLTDDQVSSMYSTAVLRFLNICAANNDRQGTFTRSVKDNDLPEWLISIRHDIAHDSKIPSVSMLLLGLKNCLQWVKEKYWEEQYRNLKDFVVHPKQHDMKQSNLIFYYIHINMALYRGQCFEELDENMQLQIKNFLPKKFRSLEPNLEIIFNYIRDLLYEDGDQMDLQSGIKELVDILVSPNVLLFVGAEFVGDDSRHIPKLFRNIWIELLNMFLKKGVLFELMHGLFTVTINGLYDSLIRETAAVWILEIFRGLLKLKYFKEEFSLDSKSSQKNIALFYETFNEKHLDLADAVDFESELEPPYEDAQVFLGRVLKEPNDFTWIYLNSIFEFTDTSKQIMEEAEKSISCFLNIKNSEQNEEIMTIGNLDLEAMETEDTSMDAVDSDIQMNGNTEAITSGKTSRWQRIDATQFVNCPLGVLPHQDRTRNPLLLI